MDFLNDYENSDDEQSKPIDRKEEINENVENNINNNTKNKISTPEQTESQIPVGPTLPKYDPFINNNNNVLFEEEKRLYPKQKDSIQDEQLKKEQEKRQKEIHLQLERFLPPKRDPKGANSEISLRFQKFWELRDQNKTINGNLENSRTFHNPRLVQNLMPIFEIEEFSSLLPKDFYDPDNLPKEDFILEINKQRELKEKGKIEQDKNRTFINFTKQESETPEKIQKVPEKIQKVPEKTEKKKLENPYLAHSSSNNNNKNNNIKNPYLSQSNSSTKKSAFGNKPKRRF